MHSDTSSDIKHPLYARFETHILGAAMDVNEHLAAGRLDLAAERIKYLLVETDKGLAFLGLPRDEIPDTADSLAFHGVMNEAGYRLHHNEIAAHRVQIWAVINQAREGIDPDHMAASMNHFSELPSDASPMDRLGRWRLELAQYVQREGLHLHGASHEPGKIAALLDYAEGRYLHLFANSSMKIVPPRPQVEQEATNAILDAMGEKDRTSDSYRFAYGVITSATRQARSQKAQLA